MIAPLKRKAQSIWNGTGLEGQGTLSTRSGALKDLPYSHRARFKNEDGLNGTNPEELIAAAHAGCFNMALSFQLNGKGFTADSLETEAQVFMGQEGVHYHIARIELNLKASVPGITEEELAPLVLAAKEGCPVSKALASVEILVNWELVA